jgi:hypothetical protein
MTALQSIASDGPGSATPLQQFSPGQHGNGVEKTAPEVNPLSPLAGERVWPTDPASLKMPALPEFPQGAGCQQLIVNSELDVLIFDDGTGTAEPWVVLWPIVYYDSTIYTSPSYSLVLDIGDSGDPTPLYDGFGQAFYMPAGLTSVTVNYNRKIDFANGVDEVFGELWSVDAQGFLDEYITGWIVGDSPADWSARVYNINDGPTLNELSGRLLALVLVNDTTDPSPGEITWFDDITLTACYVPPDYAAYMPAVPYLAGTGPSCNPPNESPPDSWYNNRGSTQTEANCNTTLSQLDDRDYYSFMAAQSGSHTIHLRNLPPGSNWAALVYNDTEPPPTAPTNGGACYTSAPGSADKSVVCTFTAGQKYVIKVSSGSTPMNGSYNLQVTKP